jgi:hypothetical protein
MPVPSQVRDLDAQQTDGNILLTWTAVVGATSYQVQRSTDGVNFVNLALVPTVNQYVDPLPGIGIMYYYQVAGVNGSGTGTYSLIVQMVAAPPGEMSLFELRFRAQQTADRVNSNFVITSEWNYMARLSLYELYDLLIGTYERFNTAPQVFINTSIQISTTGQIQQYALPDGATNYFGGVLGGLVGAPSPAFYKLTGVDLGVNTANNAWVTLHRFNWIDRNNYVYPNSTSTIYGVYNMRYNVLNNNLVIIPNPAGNQQIRLTYSPRLKGLLLDSDLTDIGWSGWLRYAIVRMAKYALEKEEGCDTSRMDAELLFLKTRIEQMASNRDEGQADTISNTRRDSMYGGTGFGDGGAWGGY